MSATAEAIADLPARRRPVLRILLFALLCLMTAGAGFFLGVTGVVPRAFLQGGQATQSATPAMAYVPLLPIIISLAPGGQSRHLKFTGQLEVDPTLSAEVTALLPRIMDVLNSYLRAVDLAMIEEPGAMSRLRGQMLRRVQMVAGPDRVSDLLVMEFLVN